MMVLSDQNLKKIPEGEWLDGLSQNLEEMDKMDRIMFW
jgi:hypothetical protein